MRFIQPVEILKLMAKVNFTLEQYTDLLYDIADALGAASHTTTNNPALRAAGGAWAFGKRSQGGYQMRFQGAQKPASDSSFRAFDRRSNRGCGVHIPNLR
ncbi:hypothetical protein [Rhodoflexus sp.]